MAGDILTATSCDPTHVWPEPSDHFYKLLHPSISFEFKIYTSHFQDRFLKSLVFNA